ncbi:hypothetical protein ABB25_01105 [Stenotrophomonas koreensis]|uniref:LamG-like jellyroll fold domain-containing protein n=1 Tax=Stenotrophomonas koreensis TaxID=266128 RepID=A0A0R0C339_9GAMM|nr:LamG-like jellyroll fold domain-containing protein [Stenotrophomonas koreensis]KRG60818.1 hypothetical protein ABB25_01105 [Stenotrophomonas koreensis]
MLRRVMMAGNAAGGGDPYWADVVALLNMPGANGSTAFPDEKGLCTWSAAGNVRVDTSRGFNVAEFDGSDDYIREASGSLPVPLRIGSGDFTVDFIVKTNGTSTYAVCGNLDDNNGSGSWWVILNSAYLGLHTVQFGSAGGTMRFGAAPLDTTAEHHIEISRSGNSTRCFVDGVQLGATQSLGSFTGSFSSAFLIGCAFHTFSGYVYDLNGYIRALRVTKAARHTANFTPPAAPFPTS